MRVLKILGLLLAILDYFCLVLSSNLNTYCGACQLLIDELEHGIGKVDPRKKIQVGSFRVDPKGNQYLNEIPYSRSEENIHELLEHVCDKSDTYGLTRHPVTGKLIFIRTTERDGRARKFEKIDTSSALRNKLKYACEGVLEEHEDDLVKFLTKENTDALNQFCHKQTNLCAPDDFVPYPVELQTEASEPPIPPKPAEPAENDDDIHEL